MHKDETGVVHDDIDFMEDNLGDQSLPTVRHLLHACLAMHKMHVARSRCCL